MTPPTPSPLNDCDITVRWTKGRGPGGQHKNKVETCCILTHTDPATGRQTTVRVDGRSRSENLRQARAALSQRVRAVADAARAAERKARRDAAIRETPTIRTYDFKKRRATDHRSGKSADLRAVLEGQIDLIAYRGE